MSHSRRKRPHAPYCGANRGQKSDKRICNRVMRRTNRVAVRFDADVFVNAHEAHNRYNWPQDGTRHYTPFNECKLLTYREWYKWALAK